MYLHRFLALPSFLLAACQPCEGPIVVSLSFSDDTAVVTWAEAGTDAFEPCRPGIMENEWGCGPDDSDAEGTFVVRVEHDGEVWEEEVVLESDGSCTANTWISMPPLDEAPPA